MKNEALPYIDVEQEIREINDALEIIIDQNRKLLRKNSELLKALNHIANITYFGETTIHSEIALSAIKENL